MIELQLLYWLISWFLIACVVASTVWLSAGAIRALRSDTPKVPTGRIAAWLIVVLVSLTFVVFEQQARPTTQADDSLFDRRRDSAAHVDVPPVRRIEQESVYDKVRKAKDASELSREQSVEQFGSKP